MRWLHLQGKGREGGAKDKGKLPIWICEPDFMADPGHRKKVVASKFYKLAMAPVAVSRVTSAMAKRLKKNWGYMIRQGKHLEDVDEFILMAKAGVEHMFNNHVYCGEWCLACKAKEEKRKINALLKKNLLSSSK